MKSTIKRILKYFFITLLILLIISGVFILFAIYLFSNSHTVYKKIRDYNRCIEEEYYQKSIKHFPKAIPDNVTESSLYCHPSSFEHDGALILLKFKVDKEYIKNEISTHKFLNAKTPVGTRQKIYHMPAEAVGIERDKLTYYVLDGNDNYNEDEQYFPYFTGIGVDKNYEYIMYYYIRPD